jgi:hypothetical protein
MQGASLSMAWMLWDGKQGGVDMSSSGSVCDCCLASGGWSQHLFGDDDYGNDYLVERRQYLCPSSRWIKSWYEQHTILPLSLQQWLRSK